jgi:SH3-like domain-containing protein
LIGRVVWQIAAVICLIGVSVAPVDTARAADKPDTTIPRFVSTKYGEVRLRQGPGERYPVVWVFMKRNMPVELTQEFDVWRKIRDWEGSEGWVLAGALQSKRYVVVTGAIRALRNAPAPDASMVARVEPGVLARLDHCSPQEADWCRVIAGDRTGWMRRSEIWGIYPQETYPAP